MNRPSLKQRGEGSASSLGRLLYRAHLAVALVAVCLGGLAVSVVGMLTLRAYAEYNLHLLGRSMAYAVEAALVFHDRVAAEEALRQIASGEEVSRCAVYDANGQLLARWERAQRGVALAELPARWWFDQVDVQPVLRDGSPIGEVRLQGSGGRQSQFLLAGLGGLLACLLLTAGGAFYLSQRMVGRILDPLDEMLRVTHAVRRDRQFSRRVPPARLAELDELAHDFNALLDELESWQSHLQRENASLAHQASHDSLTRLANRGHFEDCLARTLRDLQRQGGRAALLFIDSDGFKSINDDLGHAAGDAVLVAIARRIRGQLRESDLVARLGGDEFAVLLAPLQDGEVALRIADKIVVSMATPVELPDGSLLQTSLSIGVALYPQHGDTPEALLHSADLAMYQAKRGARGRRQLAATPTLD